MSDQEEYQKALIYFKQIDTLSPDFEGYEYGYALALQAENDREKALEIAKQGIGKNPFDAQLKLLASQLSYELHQPDQAETYLLEAKEEEAVSAYQELYEDLKDNPEFLEAYVYLLREAGDLVRAREVANQYLAIVPDDVQMQSIYDGL